ncbi:uncharacterized protein LOC132556562 [Ylistrum balloti]|uniref:uncharacterized protein LOC132556562 n=1 Tax=Ylistrum balloti TaxID=509963 RepID=UPI002905E737|nr:uncharacterized protein LOC132556562 [Ylistrum balloti]
MDQLKVVNNEVMEDIRPRCNSDSKLIRPPPGKGARTIENIVVLPEILVEDFSERKLQVKEKFETGSLKIKDDFRRCSDVGFKNELEPFQRPRASTCPDDMFRPIRKRPSTPPPRDMEHAAIRRDMKNKRRSGGKFSFAPHSLSKVTEDSLESAKTDALIEDIETQCDTTLCSSGL